MTGLLWVDVGDMCRLKRMYAVLLLFESLDCSSLPAPQSNGSVIPVGTVLTLRYRTPSEDGGPQRALLYQAVYSIFS